jgi:hypothetical protein
MTDPLLVLGVLGMLAAIVCLLAVIREARRPSFCTGCGTKIEWKEWETLDFDSRTGEHVWSGRWACPNSVTGVRHTIGGARVVRAP